MSRVTSNALLLLLGLATGLIALKGTYLYYVRPLLLPWLIVASVVLIALATVAIVRDLRRFGTADGDEQEDGHRHRLWMVWLLLVPIAVLAFVVPPPLGARGATPEVAAAAAPHRRPFPPLPDERAPVVSVPDVMMRAATDSAGTLDNRLITVIGFTINDGGAVDLGRVVIICCAADAQLARMRLTGPGLTGYPDDTWLRVEGRVVPGSSTAQTSFVPTMTVSSITKIDRPANTYAY
ncbi:MAG: TIGR03943 family protein [Mycobacteriaceae bacterium]|nr:TIGR03943 family protein [Mycobacteriaceae bacterium]MBV9640346.1 TIGR03943 family protein [Mycobacteriaceae bacterium]